MYVSLLELAHLHQSDNFYLCISAVGSGRLVVYTTHCCCIPSQFSFPVYYIDVEIYVISAWFREQHAVPQHPGDATACLSSLSHPKHGDSRRKLLVGGGSPLPPAFVFISTEIRYQRSYPLSSSKSKNLDAWALVRGGLCLRPKLEPPLTSGPPTPLGHIWDVMLVWRKRNINKTVSVL